MTVALCRKLDDPVEQSPVQPLTDALCTLVAMPLVNLSGHA